jgi:hypothetical protein
MITSLCKTGTKQSKKRLTPKGDVTKICEICNEPTYKMNWKACLRKNFRALDNFGVKGYVWYELNDGNGRVGAEGSFGLFDVNGAATPALDAYLSLANTQYVIPEASPTLFLALSVTAVTMGLVLKRKELYRF